MDVGKPAPAPVARETRPVQALPGDPFSLAAISCGGWLWLEELDSPLSAEQLQLVQAMAEALDMIPGNHDPGSVDRIPARAAASHFDWPMHTNQQLDLGQEAARASVAAFIQRKLELAQRQAWFCWGRPAGSGCRWGSSPVPGLHAPPVPRKCCVTHC